MEIWKKKKEAIQSTDDRTEGSRDPRSVVGPDL